MGSAMEELDLKLLKVFDEIYTTRSVSRAGMSKRSTRFKRYGIA